MDEQDRLHLLMRQATSLLQKRCGQGISLHDPRVIAARERSLVVRCAVTGWDRVTSVILKRNEGDDARGFTDWASLAFLSTLEESRDVAPRFYAGATRERFFVMEDLGESRSVTDLLEQSDATAAQGALISLATSMAHLVTTTAGREEVLVRLRAALPGGEGLGRRQEATRWLDVRDRVARWGEVLGISLSRHFDAACAHISAIYADPGPYLAFSHGDPAPSNNHIGLTRVCLVDFEYASYRHLLYDLTGWAILCPLPWPWVTAMEREFRRILGADAWGAPLADDGQYREAWATLCAYRALALVSWLSPELLVEDRTWAPGWTGRAAILCATLRLHQVAAGVAALTPLADLGGRMCEKLQAQWPALGDGTPRWPATASVPPS